MGYVCLDCGNSENFTRTRRYSAVGWEKVEIDGDGDDLECIDGEEEDRWAEDEIETVCDNCSSENIEWFDDEEEEVQAIAEGKEKYQNFLKQKAYLEMKKRIPDWKRRL